VFKAGAATALSNIANLLGKDVTNSKILPTLQELLKEENPEVKNNAVDGLKFVAKLYGNKADEMLNQQLLTIFSNMTKDGNWRVRMSVFDLLADLAIQFGEQVYKSKLHSIFITYLNNTAAAVRHKGVEKLKEISSAFGPDWIMKDLVPEVHTHYSSDKKGYNYRMCCLYSL